ncbi:MAG: type II toxin-antitoxin system VapC family toxin [Bacteroidota bacterium]
MIAIDTNILVRFLTNDDPSQAQHAAQLLRSEPVFIPKTVLLETEWVLRHAYGLDRQVINTAFAKLLGLSEVVAEDMPAISRALAWHAAGLDFADALHLAVSGTAGRFVTFDRDLVKRGAKLHTGMEIALIE